MTKRLFPTPWPHSLNDNCSSTKDLLCRDADNGLNFSLARMWKEDYGIVLWKYQAKAANISSIMTTPHEITGDPPPVSIKSEPGTQGKHVSSGRTTFERKIFYKRIGLGRLLLNWHIAKLLVFWTARQAGRLECLFDCALVWLGV